MFGTTGSNYEVVFSCASGEVGIRYDGGIIRTRVVPSAGCPPLGLSGWKQPGQDGQNRYSREAWNATDAARNAAAAAAELTKAAAKVCFITV